MGLLYGLRRKREGARTGLLPEFDGLIHSGPGASAAGASAAGTGSGGAAAPALHQETDIDLERIEADWAPRMLSVLRIVAALIFLEHGTQKLLGFPGGERAFADFFSLSWFAGLIELVTGALLAAGYWTRAAAFVASGEMAVAYWMAHAPQSVFPVNNGGDASILYCFVFLYIVFAGPGPWSVDAKRAPRAAGAGVRTS